MQYVTLDILKKSIGENLLAELSDADRDTTEQGDILEQINREAVSEVHSYLEGIYKLPITDNAFIERLVINLMRIRLYVRRDAANVPESIEKQYQNTIKSLVRLRSKELGLNVPLADSDQRHTNGSTTGAVRYQNVGKSIFNRGFAKL